MKTSKPYTAKELREFDALTMRCSSQNQMERTARERADALNRLYAGESAHVVEADYARNGVRVTRNFLSRATGARP